MDKLKNAIKEARSLKEFQVKHPAGSAILVKQEELFEEMDDKLELAERGLSYAEGQKIGRIFRKGMDDVEKAMAPVYKYFEEINKD